jgi:hypothetical protein
VTCETVSYHTIGPDTSINSFINSVNPIATIPNAPTQSNQSHALQESKSITPTQINVNETAVNFDLFLFSPATNTSEQSVPICFRNIPLEFELEIGSSENKHLELRKLVF